MLPKEQCLNNLQKKRFDGRMKMFIQTLYAASFGAISGLACSFPTEAFEVYELLGKRKQFLLLSRKFAQSLHIAFVYKYSILLLTVTLMGLFLYGVSHFFQCQFFLVLKSELF